MAVTRTAGAVVAALVLFLGACSDDDSSEATDDTAEIQPPTTQTPETGGLDIPDLPGTYAVPVPSLGFGIAVPENWQATLLSEDALSRLEEADLSRPGFLDAAHTIAQTGAVFYAAGVGEDGSVAELKIDVQSGADTSPDRLRSAAQSVAGSQGLQDVKVVEPDDGSDRVRVDYRIVLPGADGGDDVAAVGSQTFVPDGDRLWSLIVTSESRAEQDALLTIFESSLTFD